MGNSSPVNYQVEDRFKPPSRAHLEEAALKLLELAPLCLSLLRKDVFYYCPTGVGP